MKFDQITATVTVFFQTHLLISIAALVIVVFLFYRNPKESFKFLAFLVILAIAGYFVFQLGSFTDTGVSSIEKTTHKTKKTLGD